MEMSACGYIKYPESHWQASIVAVLSGKGGWRENYTVAVQIAKKRSSLETEWTSQSLNCVSPWNFLNSSSGKKENRFKVNNINIYVS